MVDQEREEQKAQYLRAIFDAIPIPAFIVDSDVRIRDLNTAAEQFLGPDPATALYCRGGEALGCIHSEPHGCGQADPCKSCVIRDSVRKAVKGRSTCREMHLAELRTQAGTIQVDLLVTASLLPYTDTPSALLILEDVTEILERHGYKPKRSRRKPVASGHG